MIYGISYNGNYNEERNHDGKQNKEVVYFRAGHHRFQNIRAA
jgi:hypothetical protein